MKITRVDPLTGKANTLDLPITEAHQRDWEEGMSIQNAMPHLTADQREFLMTGLMPESWNEIFKDSEDAEYGTDINDEEERPF